MKDDKSNNINELRDNAKAKYNNGAFEEAVRLQQSVIDLSAPGPDIRDTRWLAHYLYGAGKYQEAAEALKPAHELRPDNLDIIRNISAFLLMAQKYQGALGWAEKGLALAPDDSDLLDHLTHIHGSLGNEDLMLEFGRRSLELKDRQAADGMAVPAIDKIPVPAFRADQPERNIIAFGLWGRDERYASGAVQNAGLAQHIYPEWRCRFYVAQGFSGPVISRLLAAGADVVLMPEASHPQEGYFWRFHVASDPDVDRYLVRDADSILDLREREAVVEWCKSGKHFHAMRDDFRMLELVPPGLWGGVRGALPDLKSLYTPYLKDSHESRPPDQLFIRERLWPFMRQSVLIHDSIYGALGGREFPAYRHLRRSRRAGDGGRGDQEAPSGRLSNFEKSGVRPVGLRKRFIFPLTSGRTGTTYLAKLLEANLADTEVHHEALSFARFGVDVPDIALFTSFNSAGNVREIRHYWRKKFAAIRQGSCDGYAEISHPLAKVGLLENIHMLGEEVEVHIICLKRDVRKVAWSFANRLVFANNIFTWFSALDPAYPRNIVDSKPFDRFGIFGKSLWYPHEILARAEYYKILLKDHANVHFHDVDLEQIIEKEGAAKLLSKLGPDKNGGKIVLPPKANESTEWMFDEEKKKLIYDMADDMSFDAGAMARTYLGQGRRIG